LRKDTDGADEDDELGKREKREGLGDEAVEGPQVNVHAG
jgi:hypothetical protein